MFKFETGGSGMEEIAANKARAWNLDLDRGLRSSKPGAQWEEIMKLGPRLVQWNLEPPVSASVAALFKLEAGQDQALANAIMLRLADAFKGGNNFTRTFILKVLLLVNKEEQASSEGLLSKNRIPSYMEMLRRIKSVMDSGDVIARALALRAIGCLANIAADDYDVHRLVLEALESAHRQEVEAAFFAVSTFSEKIAAFAALALEKLTEMINFMRTPPELKLGAIRLLAKMGVSSLLATQAQETGRRLMLKLPTEEYVTTALTALTLLAIKAPTNLRNQVDLLFTYIEVDPRSYVRAAALTCLLRMEHKAISCTELKDINFVPLLQIAGNLDLPFSLRALALQVLEMYSSAYVVIGDMDHLLKLVAFIQLNLLEQEYLVVYRALSLLVDVTCKVEQFGMSPILTMDDSETTVSDQKKYHIKSLFCNDSCSRVDFVAHCSLLVSDQIALLSSNCKLLSSTVPDVHWQTNSSCISELQFCLSSLLFKLVKGCPRVCYSIVDYLCEIIHIIVKEKQSGENAERSTAEDVDVEMIDEETSGGKAKEENSDAIQLVFLCRCLHACVQSVHSQKTDILRIYTRLSGVLNILATRNCYFHAFKSLIFTMMKMDVIHQFQMAVFNTAKDAEGGNDLAHRLQIFQNCFLVTDMESKVKILVDQFIKSSHFWSLYGIGKHSSCFAFWPTAADVFNFIKDKVGYEVCYFWLKGLSLLSASEALLWRKRNANVRFSTNSEAETSTYKPEMVQQNQIVSFSAAVPEALSLLNAAIQSIDAGSNSRADFRFQKCFLLLRIKLLESMAELAKVLQSFSMAQEICDTDYSLASGVDAISNLQKQVISIMQSSSERAEGLVLNFHMLSQKFDILALSSPGIDGESAQLLFEVALSCSLMAFCTACALLPTSFGRALNSVSFEPKLPNKPFDMQKIIQDLWYRIKDDLTVDWPSNIPSVLEAHYDFRLQFAFRSNLLSRPQGRLLENFSRNAANEARNLQNEHWKEDIPYTYIQQRGVPFLKEAVGKHVSLPWLLPKFFFRTRPRVALEIFAAQQGVNGMEILSLVHGSALTLSMGFKVLNLPSKATHRPKKICCSINVLPVGESHKQEAFQQDCFGSWLEDLSVMKWLLSRCQQANMENHPSEMKNYVSVAVDGKGQGSTSCVLDVSHLSFGLHKIYVQSIFVDQKGRKWILPPVFASPHLKIT